MQKKFGFISVMLLTASMLACAPAPSQPATLEPTKPVATTEPVTPPTTTEPVLPVLTTPMPPTTSEPTAPVVTEPNPPMPPATTEPVPPAPPTTTEPTPPVVMPPATTEPTPPMPPTTTTTEPTPPTPPTSSIPVNVLPVSYTATVGDRTYLDDTGKQLTDTVLGGDLFNTKVTGVAAYEWVGWANKDASLSFEFNQERKFSKIRIGFNHNETAGILLPKNVVINNQVFPLTGNEVPNLKRGFVTFDVNMSARNLTIKLERNPSRQWMMVDEIRFEAR